MPLFCPKTISIAKVGRSFNPIIDKKYIEVKKRMGGTDANSVDECWTPEDLLWMRMVACTEVVLEAVKEHL